MEGATEKSLFPLIARKIGIFDHSISVIDCGGKYNLKLFMKVLNAFRLPYLVLHDEDPIDPDIKPGGSRHNSDRYNKAKKAFNENKIIKQTYNNKIGRILVISGKFENLVDITKSQVKRFGSKPFAAVQKYSDPDIEISEELQKIVREVYKLN